MTLTLAHGPLSGDPPKTVNYRVDGPQHRLLFEDFPRRIRAMLGGEAVVDTRRARLLHETGHLPQLYVPRADARENLLEATDHTTHCPFKGDAAYWSVRVGDRVAENSVWGYPDPHDDAAWLREHVALYWDAMDAWFDEQEQVSGHLCDPYHRVDVRASDRHVRVLANGEVVADTRRPMVLSETGFPNRWYVPPADVDQGRLERSDTHTICPYKGVASYWSVRSRDVLIEDAAFAYPEPLEEATRVRDHLCFLSDGLEVEVGGG